MVRLWRCPPVLLLGVVVVVAVEVPVCERSLDVLSDDVGETVEDAVADAVAEAAAEAVAVMATGRNVISEGPRVWVFGLTVSAALPRNVRVQTAELVP